MPLGRKTLPFLLCFLLTFLVIQSVTAQTVSRLILTSLDSSKFPQMDFYLEAFDESGKFIDNLRADELRVVENGSIRPISELEREERGVQVIVAYNVAPPMATRFGNTTLYELTRQALLDWVNNIPANTQDDFSLATNSGFQIIRSKRADEWSQALQMYQPDLELSKPSLNSLAQSLDLAIEPNADPFMKRMLLFITTPLSPTYQAALPNLATRARELGVQINVWLIGRPSDANTTAGQALNAIAVLTGGGMFVFSGGETLPNLEEYLLPMRQLYHGRYTSAIQRSGQQTVSIQLKRGESTLTSNQHTFDLTVHPPNPVLLSPPTRIERSYPAERNSKSESLLSPESYTLQIAVEFTDGHPRPLVRSELLVDGVVVDQNTQPPFESFTWPLAEVTTSGQHTLQVRIEDSLGLSQTTIEWPFEVTVAEPPRRLFSQPIPAGRQAIGALILGITVALVVLMIVRLRRATPPQATRPLRRITQTIPKSQPKPPMQPASASSITIPRALPSLDAPARLTRLAGDETTPSAQEIPIARPELTFGSDPQLALCVFDSPSVSPLHARLLHTPENGFVLYDAGSITGTWVNYSPVSASGVQLRHGDLIHFGRMTFRFEMSHPDYVPQPVVTPYEGDEP